MKKGVIFLLCLAVSLCSLYAVNISEEEDGFYTSITSSAEYTGRPVFIEQKYERNDIVEDIKVSLIESIPFGFLLTFAGLYVYEAIQQSSLQPAMKDINNDEYKTIYFTTIGSFAAATTMINLFTYYDYSYYNKDNNKEAVNEENK